MTKIQAIAIPILSGKTEQWKKFTNELNSRYKKEYNESRKELGVQESVFLQNGPNGDMVLVVLQGENPQEAFRKFGQKTDEFTTWFVSKVKELHELDLTQAASLPFPELIMETEPVSEKVLK